MNGIESTMAVLSHIAYACDDVSRRHHIRTVLEVEHKKMNFYYPSLELSKYHIFHVDDDMVSFVNNEQRIGVAAYRGTNISDFEDTVKADLALALGLNPARTEESKIFFQNLITSLDRIGKYTFYAIGHSLGGYFAEKIIYEFNETHPTYTFAGISFNAGSGPFSKFEGFLNLRESRPALQSNITSLRINGDPISAFSLHGNRKELQRLEKGAHTLNNFTSYALKREELLKKIVKGENTEEYALMGFDIEEAKSDVERLQHKGIVLVRD